MYIECVYVYISFVIFYFLSTQHMCHSSHPTPGRQVRQVSVAWAGLPKQAAFRGAVRSTGLGVNPSVNLNIRRSGSHAALEWWVR